MTEIPIPGSGFGAARPADLTPHAGGGDLPPHADPALAQAVEAHVVRHIGPVRAVFQEQPATGARVDVLHSRPSQDRAFHVLTTVGMSMRAMETPPDADAYRHAELLVCLPSGWPIGDEPFRDERYYWPVRWLRLLARFPHERGTWLGAGHSVPNGDPPEPIAPETDLAGFLLLPPPSLPESAHRLTLDDGRVIHFWCLVPLYAEELALKIQQGAEALFPLFDREGVTDVVNPQRTNVARKRRLWPF